MGVTCTPTRPYKTELALNNAQVTACRRHAGAARFASTWGLARKHEAYRASGTSPSAIDLPWLSQVSTCALSGSPAQPGSGVCSLLPQRPAQAARAAAGEGRLSTAEDQEARAGHLSVDQDHHDRGQCHSVAGGSAGYG